MKMSRPPRIEFPGAVHHAMARGDRREEIFLDDRDRSKFLGYLAEGAERYRGKVHCYVLMANHFHLVVTTPEGNLSKWMHQLKTAYTVYFNRRHQMVGHLFQGNPLNRFAIQERFGFLQPSVTRVAAPKIAS